MIIRGYFDSDRSEDHVTRKSISVFIFTQNVGLVNWSSKRQVTMALTSIEAEYGTLTLVAKEAIWMRLLLRKIRLLDKDRQYAIIKVARS